jgi:hypothetical protein
VTPPTRRPAARKYLTPAAERIAADCYPGQILAVLLERALREMAIRDGLLTPKTHRRRQRPAADDGPTVREAATDDRAHWTQKYAGE